MGETLFYRIVQFQFGTFSNMQVMGKTGAPHNVWTGDVVWGGGRVVPAGNTIPIGPYYVCER